MRRERDAVDYALLGAVTLLAYLHLPFRPAIRESLRGVAGTAVRHVERSPTLAAGVAVVVVAAVGGAFVAGLVRHASS